MSKAHDQSGETPRPRASISACVIARDEGKHLPDCLASVAFCDEVVVVDSGSVDDTVQIARAAGARVVEQPWLGFAAQRNVALDHARCDWVVEVDADERISPELRVEIEEFLATPPDGVELGGLPLRDLLRGHPLGASAKYPKYRHRLLRRGAYRHDERRTVHEGLIPHGAVHPFAGDLLHLYAESWGEAVGDAWRYARLEAGQLNAPRTPQAALIGAFVRPAVKFFYRLSIDGGWRDGLYGAVRIGLDCASDSVVWLRHLSGRRGPESGDSGTSTDAHYGSRRRHQGSVRVLGLAAGGEAADRAGAWLMQAQEAGMDVALIADVPCGELLRVHRVHRMRPLHVLRALEAEQQLRTIDVVVPFGRRANALLRMLGRGRHGIVINVNERDSPIEVAARAEKARLTRS
ncbi:MAG: glycosyltransferase family 2 protein [Solirubrobacteraceae bacterium]